MMKQYTIQKIIKKLLKMKIDINVPDGISGNWSVSSFTVEPEDYSQMISMMKYGRGVPAGTYKRLISTLPLAL